MRTALKLVLGISALVGTGLVASEALAKYEEPAYSVVTKEGECELRAYPSLIAAEVTVEGDREHGGNQAFKILAGYIFGKNVSKKKIAMTVPVTESVSEKIAMTIPVTTEQNGSSMKMAFYMPAEYNLENLPEPIDKRIQFKVVEPKHFAVVRFSGLAKEKSIAANTNKLNEYLKSAALHKVAEPICAFYNPPWTLPFMRRNEIWIEVSKPSAG